MRGGLGKGDLQKISWLSIYCCWTGILSRSFFLSVTFSLALALYGGTPLSPGYAQYEGSLDVILSFDQPEIPIPIAGG
jgi:hypothetical protein